jgi:hypothetical protein
MSKTMHKEQTGPATHTVVNGVNIETLMGTVNATSAPPING